MNKEDAKRENILKFIRDIGKLLKSINNSNDKRELSKFINLFIYSNDLLSKLKFVDDRISESIANRVKSSQILWESIRDMIKDVIKANKEIDEI